MKQVLWITNALIGHHRAMMGLDNSVTGATWLHAAYAASLGNNEYRLHIATLGDVREMLTGCKDGHCFYILPEGKNRRYDIQSKEHYKEWRALKDTVKPDLVVVWGTETRFAYLAMTAMPEVPVIIYMQGVIRSVASHYYEGVPFNYRMRSLRDIADIIDSKSQINNFKFQVELEEKMLKMAYAVIVENDWCENVCKGINPELRVFRNKLPIAESYFGRQWELDNIRPHTIFTNAGGYPIKGHHILFKALATVKRVYPDVKCYIPGVQLYVFNTFIRKSGYFKYLYRLIKDGDLQDNVCYVGRLTSEQMADYLTKCNVYVMPSIVENHSSSLIEAMVVGTPSISALVGGVADIVTHGKNGFLYNSLDSDSLAGIIITMFNNSQKTAIISNNCAPFRSSRMVEFGKELISIYNNVFHEK